MNKSGSKTGNSAVLEIIMSVVEKNKELEQIILSMTRKTIAEDKMISEEKEKRKVKKWGK